MDVIAQIAGSVAGGMIGCLLVWIVLRNDR
jgi:hypothetical protein